MAIFLTLAHNLLWFLGLEFYILMGWGSNANILLVGIPILYIAFVVFSILKKDVILNHLVIANMVMPIIFVSMLAIFASTHRK